MTDIEYFNFTHIPHDYIIYDLNNNERIGVICSTKKELKNKIKELKRRRAAIGQKIEKIRAHQTYLDIDYYF